MADYVRVPYWLVDSLPNNISFQVGAKVHDFATAVRALMQANLEDNSTIILTAPTEAMGALTLRLAKLFNIRTIVLVGRSKQRLKAVQNLSTVQSEILVVDAQSWPESGFGALTGAVRRLAPEGIDAIIDYVPAGNMLAQILPALKMGGRVVHFGANLSALQVPLVALTGNCWSIVGSRANTRQDARDCIKRLADGETAVDDLITHSFSISEADRMLHMMETREEPMWLTVVKVDNSIQ